jgi:hypothetical protein
VLHLTVRMISGATVVVHKEELELVRG